MRVRNNKTRKEEVVTSETWAIMQEKGIAKRFSVVSQEDVKEVVKTAAVPEEVKLLRKKPKDKTAV